MELCESVREAYFISALGRPDPPLLLQWSTVKQPEQTNFTLSLWLPSERVHTQLPWLDAR